MAEGVVVEITLDNEEAPDGPSFDKYTIFHALVDALEDKQKEKRSLLRRLRLRK